MTTHTWSNVSAENTSEQVMWRCQVCNVSCGFARKGFGDPFADETSFPDNIDDYVGVCPKSLVVPVSVRPPVLKRDFLARFTNDELLAGLKARATDSNVEAMFYRLEQADAIPLDSQMTIDGLKYLTAIGILAAGRAEEIMQ